jgi:hypothetical protein
MVVGAGGGMLCTGRLRIMTCHGPGGGGRVVNQLSIAMMGGEPRPALNLLLAAFPICPP